MQVRILIFGQLTDITGVSEITFDDISTSDEVIAAINQKYPSLADSKYAVAVDKRVIKDNTPLNHNSTVALLPPFSGG